MKRPTPIEPGPGQESVWDYPRPPALEAVDVPVQVRFGSRIVADTSRAKRVLETSHPPVYYVPPEDVAMELLHRNRATSHCEWKGAAHYYDLELDGRRVENAAWAYADPVPRFAALADHVGSSRVDLQACKLEYSIVSPK